MDTPAKPFNLRKWFSIVSLMVTGLVAVVFGAALSHFFVAETIRRDAMLTTQFIRSIAEIEALHGGFSDRNVAVGQILDRRVNGETLGVPEEALESARSEFFDHLRLMPEALLATVFATDGLIVWSNNPQLVGRRFDDNDELEEVVRTREMVAGVYFKSRVGKKLEQQFVRSPEDMFIENYVPLLDRSGQVVSVVEIYKEPHDLIQAIKRGYLLIWAAALASGAAIYFALRWIIIRAAAQLDAQQQLLVENERLVALGEMASAVAHGLRNPLAAIRSSAELGLDVAEEPISRNLKDIVVQVDRLSKWVRELLQFSVPLRVEPEAVPLAHALEEALKAFETQMRTAGIELEWDAPAQRAPPVVASRAVLAQVLNSVLANAVEAMPRGGRLAIATAVRGKHVELVIRDTGCGMTKEQLALAFKPFRTSKRGGLGVGLPLVKRAMERFGGDVALESMEGAGTTVRLTFVRAQEEKGNAPVHDTGRRG